MYNQRDRGARDRYDSHYDRGDRNSHRADDRDRHKDRDFDRRDRRSNSRDRKRYRSENDDQYRSSAYTNGSAFESRTPEPCSTIVIKGLPNHTTETTLYALLAAYYPKEFRLITQRDGECKGYAFVDFHGVEYAQYFMTTFAGSTGDPNAAQFIVENRAVTLEYARDSDPRRGGGNAGGGGHAGDTGRAGGDPGHAGGGRRPVKTDWLCETCSCHNFARRDTCFRCSSARTERCVSVPSAPAPAHGGADASLDPATSVPGDILVVKGLSPMVLEEQIQELYRQFAPVKSVSLLRDPATHFARGMAFVAFHTPEHAQYALQRTNGMALGAADMAVGGDTTIAVAFARPDVMQTLLSKATRPGAPLAVNPLVAQALQAAQWSANNGYSTTSVPGMTNSGPSASALPPQPYGTPVPVPSAPPVATVTGGLDHGGNSAAQFDTAGLVPVVVRFPPNFDTNGGSYVYQAKSGYFLEPITEFYYDPKHKRYFCARDGNYYTYDATSDPPFKVFSPPAPSTDLTTSSVTDRSASTAVATNDGPVGQSTATTTVKAAAPSAGKMKLTTKTGTGVGFGLGGNKKAKLDIAKWGALQQDDDDEQQEDPRNKGRKIGGVNGSVGSNASASSAASAPSHDASIPATNLKSQTPVVAVDGGAEARRAPAVAGPPGASTTTAPAAPTPPKPPVVAAPAAAVPTLTTVAAPSAPAPAPGGLPICMLCQRQFPSMEMLQRHERESKLHADNLRKLQGGGAAQ